MKQSSPKLICSMPKMRQNYKVRQDPLYTCLSFFVVLDRTTWVTASYLLLMLTKVKLVFKLVWIMEQERATEKDDD